MQDPTENTLLEQIVRHSVDGILVLSEEGVIEFANPAAVSLLGSGRKELLGSHLGFPAVTESPVELSIPGEEGERTVELRATEIEWQGESALLAGLRDISERKEAEKSVRRSETLLRQAEKLARVGAWEWNLQEDRFSFSEEWLRIHGCESPELSRAELMTIAHPEDREEVEAALEAVLEGRPEYALEHRILRQKDGAVRHVAARGTVVFGDDGEAERMYGSAQDISEFKESQERLRQAQKMESIGRLAGGVAHDFNNLLTAITGYAEMAESTLESDHSAREDIKEIKRAAESAAHLTSKLLSFSRKQTLSPSVIDVNSRIENSLHMLERLIEESIELAFRPQASLWPVRFDPGQVDQVLMNLAINSRDAMKEGGRLTIETGNVQLKDSKCHACAATMTGDYVQISVSDSGIGMNRETTSKIFEPFFTTKEDPTGTGLGLSSVLGTVHQQDGHVNVYSEPGLGTTFKIYIPRVQEKISRERDEEKEKKKVASTRGETILLVEDEDSLRRLSRRILERAGYEVIEAENGEKALELATNFPGDIDLLLTDIVMPRMNGQELYRKLATREGKLPVLFMSGYPGGALSKQDTSHTSGRFIQKPFQAEDLLRAVAEALEGDDNR